MYGEFKLFMFILQIILIMKRGFCSRLCLQINIVWNKRNIRIDPFFKKERTHIERAMVILDPNSSGGSSEFLDKVKDAMERLLGTAPCVRKPLLKPFEVFALLAINRRATESAFWSAFVAASRRSSHAWWVRYHHRHHCDSRECQHYAGNQHVP